MIYLRVYSLLLITFIILIAAICFHASRKQAATVDQSVVRELVQILPSADTGIDNASRYIRHLGLSTFHSSFPDFPGQIDYLPEGMTWSPPETISHGRLDSK